MKVKPTSFTQMFLTGLGKGGLSSLKFAFEAALPQALGCGKENIRFQSSIYLLEDASFFNVGVMSKKISSKVLKETATGFADWIFRLDKGCSKPSSLLMGKVGERIVNGRKGIIPSLCESPWERENQWELIYIDPIDEAKNLTPFTSSLLTVNKNPVRCRPDIVLKHKLSKVILILETKVTKA